MSEVTAGTLLACAHEHCGCEVEVRRPCGCSDVAEYRCHCGAAMIPRTA